MVKHEAVVIRDIHFYVVNINACTAAVCSNCTERLFIWFVFIAWPSQQATLLILPVRLSVCVSYELLTRKQEKVNKNKIGVNVLLLRRHK